MYHLECLPYVANCTFIFSPAFGLQLKNEIHFISAKPHKSTTKRLLPPEPRSISSLPIVPRRPSSPLSISLPGSPEYSSGMVDDEYRTIVSLPKTGQYLIIIVKTLVVVTPIHLYRDVQRLWAIAPPPPYGLSVSPNDNCLQRNLLHRHLSSLDHDDS